MAGQVAEQRGGRAFVIDTAVVALTQVILRLRGLVLLPLIVKLLGTAAYGVWAQVVAFAMFLTAIVSMNFHLPLVREIAAKRERAAPVYSTLFVATLAISGVVAGALALVPGPLAEVLLDARGAAHFMILGLLLMIASNVRLLNVNLYRATGRLAVRSVIELSTAVGEIAGIIVLLRRGHDVDDVLGFMVAWNGGIAVLQSVHCFTISGWHAPQWSIVKAALVFAVPLIPASFATFALDRMDRFVVGYYKGAEGVGIYSANYAIGGLIMMAQTPFQMTLLPKVAELWDRDRAKAAQYIELSLTVFVTLAIPFVVGLPLIADEALTLLGNAQIADEAALITFLISAGVSAWAAALVHSQVFTGAGRTGAWGIIVVAATVLNLVLNLILVPLIGVAGAAAATLASYTALGIAVALVSRSILTLHYDGPHLLACCLAALGMGVLLLLVEPTGMGSLVAVIVGAIAAYALLLATIRAAVPALRGTTIERLSVAIASLRR